MVTKEKLYSLIIITIYLMSCFTIFNDTKSKTIYTKIKEKNITPIEKDIIGSISIDKINLQKPLYKIESKKNNVDENVTILKESIFPDEKESILFIAAHSGNSNISYFKDLNKLTKNDKIKINYLNKEYIYQIISIWEEDKNGYIHINKESKKQLILTTCSPMHKNKQLVINSIIA